MAQTTIVINECDRCGHQENAADYGKGNSWGQMTVGWKGDTGGRTWSGDAGGLNHSGRAWLCHRCTEQFLAFIARQPKPHETQGGNNG